MCSRFAPRVRVGGGGCGGGTESLGRSNEWPSREDETYRYRTARTSGEEVLIRHVLRLTPENPISRSGSPVRSSAMSPTPPPVAFSLSAPLVQAVRATRRQPAMALAPVAVMLLPLVPLLGGVRLVLAEGGSGALQGLLAGAPRDRAGALILRPELEGWLLLAALVALVTTMVAVIVAAGLIAGATASRPASAGGDADAEPSVAAAVRHAMAVWPAMLVVIVGQLLAVAALASGIGGLAWLAGKLQFQLPAVVLTLGLGWLLIAVIRLSLWPAIGIADAATSVRALRRSWTVSRGSVARLVGAAVTAFLGVAIPTVVLHGVIKLALTALASAEAIGLSPVAIDLWAFVPVPLAIFALSALWGREAPVLLTSLRSFAAARRDAD